MWTGFDDVTRGIDRTLRTEMTAMIWDLAFGLGSWSDRILDSGFLDSGSLDDWNLDDWNLDHWPLPSFPWMSGH